MTHEPLFFDELRDSVRPSDVTRQTTCGCSDTNECDITNICPINAECTNSVASYDCSCVKGFETVVKGPITACIDIDECLVDEPCSSDAICINNDGSFECHCNTGFSGNGLECKDIDECQNEAAVCQANADCVNNTGSYV